MPNNPPVHSSPRTTLPPAPLSKWFLRPSSEYLKVGRIRDVILKFEKVVDVIKIMMSRWAILNTSGHVTLHRSLLQTNGCVPIISV